MPRYFFHIRHMTLDSDIVGEELADPRAAWKEAIVTAGQMLQDLGERLRPENDWSMEVTDESANALYSVRVSTMHH
jgi:hypothetical protein